MLKEITKKGLFINLTSDYLMSKRAIIDSPLFRKILTLYVWVIKKRNVSYYITMRHACKNDDDLVNEIIKTSKSCLVFKYENIDSKLKPYRSDLVRFIEDFYNFYRKYERYVYIISKNDKHDNARELIELDQKFGNLVLEIYRHISENVRENNYLVYRQLNAGSNAGFVLTDQKFKFSGKYEILNKVKMISSVILHPPFIIYSKNNKRSGIFQEAPKHPLEYVNRKNLSNFIMYPIYIGRLKAYCYFNVEYASLGVSLCNLFSPIEKDKLYEKPDIVLMYGVDNAEIKEAHYYHDEQEGLYVGIAPKNDEMTYFGYLKKILLTLHNLKCIDNDEIPLHGAMVSIKLRNGNTTNVTLIGDSGAGKSETLEALKQIMDDDISEMTVIFDDMGAMDKNMNFFGTETGAFVRMDDLENGYAYKEIDRAVFMNPDQKNARTIIPVTTLDDVQKGYKCDIILYANNYEDKNGIRLFKNADEALGVFKKGKRKAKGTTSESGIVESYFANPFGPVQREQKMDILLDRYFNEYFKKNILVGEIYTRLGVSNYSQNESTEAAKSLIKFIK